MKERKIAWERWVDFDPEEEVETIDDEDDAQEFEILPLMVRTPIGTYSPLEPMTPTKMFDCWICHTNFDITESDKCLLDLVEGIEVLKIMSRYRFFIGIGKLFSLTDVRPKVEAALYVNKNSAVMKQIIEEISGKKKWAVGIYADGSHTTIYTNSEEDESYDKKLVELRDSGVVNILTSDEF
jgi:hypothetical protein